MDKDQDYPLSHLFTVRLWPEALGDGQVEWRGKVEYIVSGERRYFRDWSTLINFLQTVLPEAASIPETKIPESGHAKSGSS